ncbi:cation diffusion facilitator family transporter [Sphingomonas bacterium]|uniref:cation diffusion facilitator family transporter n=1 Tax=Sphingomonas bacterium TaxID=1895847 RepID=UPI00157749D2|nr:cation diffusion facilitator family transporter [Sphingomonas bacterium]
MEQAGHQGHHGHDHAHGHDHEGHDHHGHHDHTAGASAGALRIALCLSGSVLIAELFGAYFFNSLALLSDAAHMLTDVAALAIALLAIKIGTRAADDRRSFGYKRLEIVAAAFNALMMFVAAAYVVSEAVGRFRTPEHVATGGVMAVAVLALVVNLIAMRLLMGGRGESMAMRSAYLEVLADAIGSFGVIVGAALIYFTGWLWIDPVVAIAIALWILPRTWSLLSDTINVLLEGVPKGMSLAEIRGAIAAVSGVRDVHDLHIWSMSTNEVNGTAHVAVEADADSDSVRRAVAHLLQERFAIGHATIQTEREPCSAEARLHP